MARAHAFQVLHNYLRNKNNLPKRITIQFSEWLSQFIAKPVQQLLFLF